MKESRKNSKNNNKRNMPTATQWTCELMLTNSIPFRIGKIGSRRVKRTKQNTANNVQTLCFKNSSARMSQCRFHCDRSNIYRMPIYKIGPSEFCTITYAHYARIEKRAEKKKWANNYLKQIYGLNRNSIVIFIASNYLIEIIVLRSIRVNIKINLYTRTFPFLLFVCVYIPFVAMNFGQHTHMHARTRAHI